MFFSKPQEVSSQVKVSNARASRRETMANDAHRTNVLVTSCLKTPVDPHTKAPVALYERERAVPCGTTGHMMRHNLDIFQREMEYEDSGSEFGDRESSGRRDSSPFMIKDYRVTGDHLDLREIFFSNEEYYSKLEELKKAHLRTMAELESMYRKNLQLKSTAAPLDAAVETGPRLPWVKDSPAADSHGLRKFHSAIELRRGSGLCWTLLDTSDEEEANTKDMEKGLPFSPKDHIKNMWKDFKLSQHDRHPSSSSLQSLPSDNRRTKGRGKKKQGRKESRHRVTVPEPFHMTMREAERRRRGFKTRSEIEHENAELRKQLEELTECQRKFRASPLPAHVRQPLYEELRERDEERRRSIRERHPTVQKPFSFLERERLKREQREEQLRHLQPSAEEAVKPFRAKPVPKAVYEAATGEQMKEEQLYRAIKMQMRAKEMLCSSSMPPSMLAQRLSERKTASPAEEDSHRPKINKEVPDFDASYRRFQKHLETRKEVRPVTACEPFQLRTSQISSHRERILADIEKDMITSPRLTRWPAGPARTPNSSLCSSLSGSLELLPGKVTDAAKKRQEAVRKVLEQRKKAEDDEEMWKEKQKQREKRLQKVVLKRAQANDPHMALSQTNQTKLKEFRKQDLQRKREYQQEIKEIQERVKGRPLLLEQVAQRNAKLAAEKRYTDALRSCGLSEDFISSKVPKSLRPGSHSPARKSSLSTESKQSDKEETDMGYIPVQFRKVYLDDEDSEPGSEERNKFESNKEEDDGTNPSSADGEEAGHGDAENYSDDNDHYSDDHENDSDNSENDLTEERHQDDDLIKQHQSSRSNQHSRNSQGSDRESTV